MNRPPRRCLERVNPDNHRVAVVLAALALLTAACGTRLSEEELVQAQRVELSPEDGSISQLERSDTGGTPRREETSPTAEAPDSPRTPADRRTQSADQRALEPSSPSDEAQPEDASPIRIGSVSALSGPAGAAQRPGVVGVQIWTRWINDHGGINGRPVEYLVIDDGSDPARHISAVRELVETHGVVAFVGQFASQTHPAAVDYLEQRRVPVVGGEASLELWNDSPMYFPQNASIANASLGRFQTAARFAPEANNVGILVCVEAQVCDQWRRLALEHAPAAGFDVVYDNQASLGQPDFTAECLAARNAGVEVFYTIFDQNAVRRVAESCARQGFTPHYITGNGNADNASAQIEAFEGASMASPTFPWTKDFARESEAAAEFHEAHQSYAADLTLGPVVTQGWVAGKLFEQALGTPGGEIGTEQVLEGLWAMQGETLGGLTVPLTFVRDEPAPEAACVFPMRVRQGRWVAPSGLEPLCP